VLVCPRCGSENPEEARFCSACGSPLGLSREPREERKVVTVVFADLVGFTSRSERLDPEDVRATLSPYFARLRRELERRGGTVEKFIGDAVMAVFGAPLAHEDDPERAVRAALAIRDAVAEMNEETPDLDLHVRVGVNSGEALVTLGARPLEGEGMAAGDVVNTAARLQSAAPVDGVLVGEATYRATERAIEYAPIEPIAAKGKEEPVPAWEATGARSRFGVDVTRRVDTPLVGRTREIALIRDALDRTREDHSSQLITLVGEPGIGKSRLVFELSEIADQLPDLIFWRQGRCLPYGDGVSFWALGEMVKAQAAILESDPDELAGRKIHEAVERLIPEREEAGWVERHLLPLVGVGADEGVREAGGEGATAAWRRFLEAIAERGPTVLVFEDLHWADDGLLDFVDDLVDWSTGVPLLVVCTSRPELLTRRPGWGGGKTNAVTISLTPLSTEETARLIGNVLHTPVLVADVQAQLLERAGGNPLYAEEFARMVEQRDRADAGGPLELPETIQGVIAARLDGLEAKEKALLQTASVLGKVFWVGAVVAIGSIDRDDAEAGLRTLERRRFIRRERRSSVEGEHEYVFLHALVRDVAYGQLPRARRADAHRTAAEWISSQASDRVEDRADLLAHHYLAALGFARASGQDVSGLQEPARLSLRAAGDRAFALGSAAVAERFYREAVTLWPLGDPERPSLLLRLGRTIWLGDRGSDAELIEARDALITAGDEPAAAEAEMMLGNLRWWRAQADEALVHFRRARSLVEGREPSASTTWVVAQLARFLMLADENDDSIALARTALEAAESLGRPDLVALSLNTIGTAKASLGDRSGLDDLERSIAIAESAGAAWDVVRGHTNLATMRYLLGEVAEAAQIRVRGLAIAERFGIGSGVRWHRSEMILDAYHAGSWDEAELRSDALLDDIGDSAYYMENQIRLVRARIGVARGDAPAARAEMDRALAIARDAKDPQSLHLTLGDAALLALQIEDPSTAAQLLDELRGLLPERLTLTSSYWIAQVAMVLEAGGRSDEALGLIERAVPSRWVDAATLLARGEMGSAADLLGEIGAFADEAYARLLAAERSADSGSTDESETQARRALAFFTSVHATRWIGQAEALLAASA
jgi:class 3 adenylate cyclase/tetratricopeptide (TPR) repeat protein